MDKAPPGFQHDTSTDTAASDCTTESAQQDFAQVKTIDNFSHDGHDCQRQTYTNDSAEEHTVLPRQPKLFCQHQTETSPGKRTASHALQDVRPRQFFVDDNVLDAVNEKRDTSGKQQPTQNVFQQAEVRNERISDCPRRQPSTDFGNKRKNLLHPLLDFVSPFAKSVTEEVILREVKIKLTDTAAPISAGIVGGDNVQLVNPDHGVFQLLRRFRCVLKLLAHAAYRISNFAKPGVVHLG